MRSAFQQYEHISYIFMGSQQSLMEMIFTSEKSPFYEFAAKMNIDPINKSELTAFIDKKFKRANLKISSGNIEAILNKSEGHPHFTQYFASVVFDLIRNGVNQNEATFTGLWIEKIIQSQSVILQGIYDQLTNIQRAVLSALADLKKNKELFSSATRDKYRLPVSSSIVTAIVSLSNKGLIEKKDGQYHILNPILKEWIRTLN